MPRKFDPHNPLANQPAVRETLAQVRIRFETGEDPLSVPELAALRRVNHATAKSHRDRLVSLGLWPWPTPDREPEYDPAEIDVRIAAVRAEKVARGENPSARCKHAIHVAATGPRTFRLAMDDLRMTEAR